MHMDKIPLSLGCSGVTSPSSRSPSFYVGYSKPLIVAMVWSITPSSLFGTICKLAEGVGCRVN